MTTFSTMQRPQQELPPTQQSRSFGHYTDSNPSSTHSSPRSFPSDLDNFYPTHHLNPTHSQTYPIPAGATMNPYIPAQQRRPHPHMQASRSSSYSSYAAPVSLQVSTSTSSMQEHDPNERTARPGNAHVHAQFHSSLTAGTSAVASSLTTSLSSNSTSASASATSRAIAEGAADSDANADVAQSGGKQPDFVSSTPGLSAGLTRPLKPVEQERLAHLDRLKFFLATAPSSWDAAANNAKPPQPQASSSSGFTGGDFSSPYGSGQNAYGSSGGGFSGMGMNIEPAYHHAPPHPALNRFLLPNQEFVTCVLWNSLYHITGTDIVRALVFRFEAFGRPVRNMKKFEEGVFSDLRNLKPGVDACLEEPKSPFLDLLFKYQCIRTQKKQKVFYWFSVPHDRLFLDALERDLKREKMGLEATTQIVGEPALSFTYDTKRSLYEQFSKAQGAREGEGELETAIRIAEDGNTSESRESGGDNDAAMDESESEVDDPATGGEESDAQPQQRKRLSGAPAVGPNGHPFFPLLSLFEGSPTYKQRRKKGTKGSMLRKSSEDFPDDYERGRSMGAGEGRLSSLSRERRPPMPAHPSMLHEFGPGSADEKARETEELSAADMFLKQARGQLVPGDGVVRKPKPQYVAGDVSVVYHQDGSAQQQQQQLQLQQQQMNQQQGGHLRRSSADVRIREYADFSDRDASEPPLSAPYSTTTFDTSQAPPQGGQPQQGMTSISQYEAVSADGKVRAFVCPLYSCGRLFKRMEHLKRHLRTHTMERPFTCTRCNKKFSRSDNLTQHLRTHERTGHGPVPGASSDTNGWMENGTEEGDISGGEGSANGGSPGQSVADSEDDGSMPGMLGFGPGGVGGMEMFGEPGSLGMIPMDISAYGFGVQGFGGNQLDETMCEVEVQGGVRDVQGDEEGEVMRMGGVESSIVYRSLQQQQQLTGSEFSFNSQPSSAATSGVLFSSSTSTDFSDGQWANRPQPSPAFSATSAPSPPPASMSMTRNSTHGSPAGGYMRHMQPQHSHSHSSSSSQSSSNFGDDYSLASLSAPSHKQSFDHATLYPPNVLENAAVANAGGNIGPVRRHRSMTPSLARSGEPIRRPMTANSSELQGVGGGSPASVSSMNSNSGAPRGYHPYYSNSNSRANSTHNSPQVLPIPLGNEYGTQGQAHRPQSRNSSYGVGGLHEQMRQMMNMDGSSAAGAASVFSDNMFRTGSPASFHQTESPGTFNIDLPLQYTGSPGFMPAQIQQQQQQQQIIHAATMPVGNQYSSGQQQQQYDGYYVQQPHATL